MIKLIKILACQLIFWWLLPPARAQDQILTIEEAYKLARQNYPMIKQRDLIAASREFSVENAKKGYLPQFSIQGQATYQSEVTEFRLPVSIPGVEFPKISKDQYKLYGEANQVVYDGGNVKTHVKAQEASALVEEQKLEVELYKLNERVNQLFFGVLIADAQLEQSDMLKRDIQLGINKVEAQITNGTALKSNANILKAELLKAQQRDIELKTSRKAYLDMLSMLLNQQLGEAVTLVKPGFLKPETGIDRPELTLYTVQNQSLAVQEQLISVKNRPRLNLFFQGGFGRPALNILNNSFDPYYITGARLSWSLSGLYTAKNERKLIGNNRQAIQLQRETFLFNTSLSARQQNAELERFEQLLATDDEIIALRERIKAASAAQLENGIINSSDYLREVNAEDQSRQAKILHEIQLLVSAYNLQTTLGKPIE
ncbi:TolC family protein [Dyadobacter aurulentus]|uniref:TolC family protein n=1 Tax=Dyadobacter sp. UC 10 TaxID=2605428 RepID=UPI0011F29C46|nr:TolC family protein [Dyadobacter sp. UC 10]KAA0992351.1 TolC family protein [Dyadobacter sp. UC 10]